MSGSAMSQNTGPVSSIECSVCGELVAGPDGHGLTMRTGYRDDVCEACYETGTEVIERLMPGTTPEAKEAAFTSLIRMLARTGHKARVRVKYHEATQHREQQDKEF